MTKGCKILSIELPEAVYHQLTSEAQAPPFLGNRSQYTRGIIEGRHEKTIVIFPKAQAQIDYYEQQLAQQAQQHQQQLAELLQAHEQQLFQQAQDFQQQLDQQAHLHAQQAASQDERHRQQLDGQTQRMEEHNQGIIRLKQQLLEEEQAYEALATKYGVVFMQEGIAQLRHEADVEKLANQTEKLDKQTEKLEALTRAHKELQAQYNKTRGSKYWFEWSTGFIEKNPALVQKGLGSLFSGKASDPAAAEPSFATQLGQGIIESFPGPELKLMTDILRYLRDNPNAKATLVEQPAFMAYQTKLRANAAGENHE